MWARKRAPLTFGMSASANANAVHFFITERERERRSEKLWALHTSDEVDNFHGTQSRTNCILEAHIHTWAEFEFSR